MTIPTIKKTAGAGAGLFGLLTLWEAKDGVVALFGVHLIGAAEHGLVAAGALAATKLLYAG